MIPKGTEIVAFHRYERTETRKSNLGLSGVQDVSVGFFCPRCGENHPTIEHGESVECWSCDLSVTLWGNTLHCKEGKGRE